jgi:hypothetical protein
MIKAVMPELTQTYALTELKRPKRRRELFDESITPGKVAFWHVLIDDGRGQGVMIAPHYIGLMVGALDGGWSAGEMERLAFEWILIDSYGMRDVTGAPCLCAGKGMIKPELYPEAINTAGGYGDSRASLIGLHADFLRAADETLPLLWPATGRIFEAQGRGRRYDQLRALLAARPPALRLTPRPLDLEPQPVKYRENGRPINQSRGEAYRRMAHLLGWKYTEERLQLVLASGAVLDEAA